MFDTTLGPSRRQLRMRRLGNMGIFALWMIGMIIVLSCAP